MPDAVFYRNEARRCRELAARAQDAGNAERWRSLAREYDLLAEALEDHRDVAPPARGVTPPQSQPMQQQQAKETKK